MRRLLFIVLYILSFVVPQTVCAAGSSGDTVAGTYDLLICTGTCSFDEQTNAVVKGRIVLFANELGKNDLQRFDENRLSYHFGEAINGCFTLETVRKSSIYAGLEKIGLTSWSEQEGQFRFSLYHSPDAGYQVSVERKMSGLAGTGSSWGAGVAAPKHPSKEIVIARRTGDADISNCTFQTAEEHEFRRLLADPARDEVFAIEKTYRQKLGSDLQISILPSDWAMAGWLDNSEEGEAEILHARKAVPKNQLVQWMAVIRTHPYSVPVIVDGASRGETFQYKEPASSALAELQLAEPENAALWLMSLRNAVDLNDAGATDAAMARLASSTYYDDHAVEFLKAQLELFQNHPLPPAFFAAVARLDPGWKLNGAFTKDVAPYYQNHYPFANIGINNLFFMPAESGMHELFVVCVQRSDRSVARKDACSKTGRMLAARSRRAQVREDASMLLSEINDFVNEDVLRAREQAWIASQYSEIHPRTSASRPFVQDEIAFISDWIESSDEFEAMRRAVARAGKPFRPPEDFQLNKAMYGNFEKARAKETERDGGN
jgi:hypothetical protein